MCELLTLHNASLLSPPAHSCATPDDFPHTTSRAYEEPEVAESCTEALLCGGRTRSLSKSVSGSSVIPGSIASHGTENICLNTQSDATHTGKRLCEELFLGERRRNIRIKPNRFTKLKTRTFPVDALWKLFHLASFSKNISRPLPNLTASKSYS